MKEWENRMRRKFLNLTIIFITMLLLSSCREKTGETIKSTESLTTNSELKTYTSESFDSWEKAYQNVIAHAEDFLMDLSDPQKSRKGELYSKPFGLYLGIHDFDNNGIPELVISDIISIGVFTYDDKYIKRIGDISVDEVPWGVNGAHYVDNCIYFQCDGSDGSYYVCWTYCDGEFVTGMYNDYMPTTYILNGAESSYEEFDSIFKFDDMKDYENNRIGFYELDNDAGTLQVIGYDTNVLKEGEVVDIENISIGDLELEFGNSVNDTVNIIVKRDDIILKCDNSGTGIVKDIENLVWMSLRSNDILSIGDTTEEVAFISESNLVLSDTKTMSDGMESGYWIRVINSIQMPLEGTSITGHKDYMVCVEGEDVILAVQSCDDLAKWSLYRLSSYGIWLEKEIDIILQLYTGL